MGHSDFNTTHINATVLLNMENTHSVSEQIQCYPSRQWDGKQQHQMQQRSSGTHFKSWQIFSNVQPHRKLCLLFNFISHNLLESLTWEDLAHHL